MSQNDQNIKFSVITVCYNSEKTIEKTLQSIKDQTYRNIEYIIIDGGSTDKTLDIVDKYKEIVDKLVSEPDNGIYDAMNKGLSLATGDYIGFLNSDDYYTNGIFEEYSSYLVNHKNIDFVYCDTIFFNNEKSWTYNYPSFNTKKFDKHLMKYNPFCHQTLYVKNKIFNQIGCFDTSFKIAADYDFFLRLRKNVNSYQGKYIPIIGCYFNMTGASSQFFQSRVEDVRCRVNNGYHPIFSWYIFCKLSLFYFVQKLPLMKDIKRAIKKEKAI